MRILGVFENYWPVIGGAELALQAICEGMATRGHQVTVVTHQPKGAPLAEMKNGVAVVRVPCRENRYLFTFLAVPKILEHAQDSDLIHTATFNAAPPSWLGSRLTRRPVLITVHETWLGRWAQYTNFSATKAKAHEVMERAIFSLAYDRYIGISHSTADRLVEVLPKRRDSIGCIYYGFDPMPWKVPIDRAAVRSQLGAGGEFLIVGYGRPGISKGFGDLVDAVPRITEAVPNAVVLLVLSEANQHRAELDRLKARAPNNVRFLPPQPFESLVKVVKAADCVVVPSIAEGFGYSTLEAVAADIPVVASKTTSITEVIGGSYLFSNPRDPESIAAAVIAVSKGQVEKHPVRSFPWSSTFDRYEQEFRRLCQR